MVAAISWSGGKDGWLALLRARSSGYEVRYALTMFDRYGARSRSHAVPPDIMAMQVGALGLEPVWVRAPWERYEAALVAALRDFARRNVDQVIFGDIDIDAHRAFEEQVCASAGLEAILPIWQGDRLALVEEMFAHRLKATVVTTDDRYLDGGYCGRRFDRTFVAALPPGVDRCGENGEFHTFVTGGVGFADDLPVVAAPSYAHEASFSGTTARYHFAPLQIAGAR